MYRGLTSTTTFETSTCPISPSIFDATEELRSVLPDPTQWIHLCNAICVHHHPVTKSNRVDVRVRCLLPALLKAVSIHIKNLRSQLQPLKLQFLKQANRLSTLSRMSSTKQGNQNGQNDKAPSSAPAPYSRFACINRANNTCRNGNDGWVSSTRVVLFREHHF